MAAIARKRGFTLIELLVVIAIIALLASILMPTLQKAQEMARMLQCGSQMRHVGTGYATYANDYDDYIVSTCFPDGMSGGVYFGQAEMVRNQLLKYMSVKGKPVDPANPFSADNRSHPVFCCPTASKKMDTGCAQYAAPGDLLWDSTGPSIVFNSGPAADDPTTPPEWYYYQGEKGRLYTRKFGDLKWAAETAGIADTCVYGFWTFAPVTSPYSPVRYRHIGDRLNVLAGDIHMSNMTSAQGASAKPPFDCYRYH